MVGSAAIKQGRSANRKHTYFFFGLNPLYTATGTLLIDRALWHMGESSKFPKS